MFRWLTAALALAGCAPAALPEPELPNGGDGNWSVALYRPLELSQPHIVATLGGEGGSQAEGVLLVDSGAAHSAFSKGLLQRIGVKLSRDGGRTITDIANNRRQWEGGVVPRVRLGDSFTLTHLEAAVASNAPLLGANVLSRIPWELDLDTGVLVLGGELWELDSQTTRIGLDPVGLSRARTGAWWTLPVSVADRRLTILLDTGAAYSIADEQALAAVDLPKRRLSSPVVLVPGGQSYALTHFYDAQFRLGTLPVGVRRIGVHPRFTHPASVGVVGTDVLSQFRFRVSGRELWVRPRDALLESTAKRIARWSDAPHCSEHVGCVSAQIPPGVDPAVEAAVELQFYADYHRPTSFTFTCGSQNVRAATWFRATVAQAEAGQARRLSVPKELRSTLRRCSEPRLLDVNPWYPTRFEEEFVEGVVYSFDARSGTFL